MGCRWTRPLRSSTAAPASRMTPTRWRCAFSKAWRSRDHARAPPIGYREGAASAQGLRWSVGATRATALPPEAHQEAITEAPPIPQAREVRGPPDEHQGDPRGCLEAFRWLLRMV